MSDLCSPISILIENEADAFWCFERLMRRMVCLLHFFNLSLFVVYMCLIFLFLESPCFQYEIF